MSSMDGVGREAGKPIDVGQRAGTPRPPGIEATRRSVHPAVPVRPAPEIGGNSSGHEGRFRPTGKTSTELPGGADLMREIMTAETNMQFRALREKIGSLETRQRQIDALAQLTQRIPDISPVERLRALHTVCDAATFLARRGADCSAVFRYVPLAAKSVPPTELFDAYLLAAGVIPSGPDQSKSGVAGENYGEYFAGIVDLLIDLSDRYQLKTPDGKRLILAPVAEVHFIFNELEKIPAGHCMKAIELLALKRTHFPTEASHAITRRALGAVQRVRFSDDQRIVIGRALTNGLLEIPESDTDRFDIEFNRLYEVSPNQAHSGRIATLLGLAEVLGHRSLRAARNDGFTDDERAVIARLLPTGQPDTRGSGGDRFARGFDMLLGFAGLPARQRLPSSILEKMDMIHGELVEVMKADSGALIDLLDAHPDFAPEAIKHLPALLDEEGVDPETLKLAFKSALKAIERLPLDTYTKSGALSFVLNASRDSHRQIDGPGRIYRQRF